MIVKYLSQYFKLGGNYEIIWVEKYASTFNFDGKFMTPKGVIYYMYLKRNKAFWASTTDTNKPVTLK